jgi:chromosomal replication initiator protein
MQVWEQFLQHQESELGIETVQKWLRSLKIQKFDACNIYLEAKDSFQALWFEEHMRSKVQVSLVNGNNKKIKVHLTVINVSPTSKKPRPKANLAKIPAQQEFKLSFDELDPLCLLDNFVLSEENGLTYKLLCELAENSRSPSSSLGAFNPIYLFGSSGSGKTHFLMGLTHAFRHQGLRAIYARAETFTDHVVSAIRAGEMSLFRQTYRHADVLLIDDVHVFSRKGATQEEFFHTFNTLHLEGKQIILTANCAPQELQLIEPRLTSRFEWGIVLPLKPSNADKMTRLLYAKAQALQFPLSSTISDFLVEQFTSSPKALIKALEALVLRLHYDSHHPIQHLNVTAVRTLLADLLIEEQKSALTPLKIIQAVAEHYGIRSEDILGKAQTRECALPRQFAMYVCRNKLKLPFMKIGDLFSRDHSTVMASVKHVQKAIDANDPHVSAAWHIVQKKLQHA